MKNAFPNLPASFAETCGKLEWLLMSSNGIETVDSNALKGLSNLRKLHLDDNRIVYIEPSTFYYTPNLYEAKLAVNEITEISPDTFKGLTNLSVINFEYNKIAVLHMLNLVGSPNLEGIFLTANQIDAIDPLFTSDFPGTRTTNCSLFLGSNICINKNYSSLNVIHENEFENCYANYKRITETETTIITEVPTTTTLAETTTVALNSGTCGTKTQCRYFLDQHKNYACVLEDVRYSLTEIGGNHAFGMSDDDVTFLFFINSKLSVVPRIIFDKYPNLKFLSVESTHLNIINDETFEVCGSKLKEIDASHNQIYRIDESSLTKCISLERMDLTGNPIEKFDGNLFQGDSKLIHIVMNHENE